MVSFSIYAIEQNIFEIVVRKSNASRENLYKFGKSSADICKEYEMSSSILHKWIKKYTEVKVSDTETMTVSEIKKLQKRLALLEEENIILKKAMAIFTKE